MSLTDTPTAAYEYPVPIINRSQNVSDFSQGATYFYVYTKYIDEYSRVLLDDYIRTGEAEAVILHDRFQRADDRWQAVELQLLKVLVMSVHYVQKFFDDYILHRLDPKEGVVRHYRDVKSGNWGKVWLKGVERMGNFSMTDYPELYSAPLLKNVQDRVRFVYGGISQNTTIK
ncbi:hypothetical protein OSTOST_09753 [Ostertagia ostertagi]